MTDKMWGGEPFWGLGYEWDPDWVYTDGQKELRATLIELCEGIGEGRGMTSRNGTDALMARAVAIMELRRSQ